MRGEKAYQRRKAEKAAAYAQKNAQSLRVRLAEPIVLFTGVLAIATMLLVIVGGLQYCTLAETDQTLNTTLEITQRPWVSLDVEIAGPLVFTDKQMSLALRMITKNTGYAPANNVLSFPMLIGLPGIHFPADELKKRCPRPVPKERAFGNVLFRDGRYVETTTISQDTAALFGNKDDAVPLDVIVCTTYELPFVARAQRTAALYWLNRIDPSVPSRALAIRRGTVTTPNQPTASLTLPGYGTADLSNGRLAVDFGFEADHTPFMHIKAAG